MMQIRGAGGLVMGKAQGTRYLLAVTTTPVGNRAGTPVATQHGDTYERENGRQGMPPTTCLAWVRNLV
jgi:hypothetical protein